MEKLFSTPEQELIIDRIMEKHGIKEFPFDIVVHGDTGQIDIKGPVMLEEFRCLLEISEYLKNQALNA